MIDTEWDFATDTGMGTHIWTLALDAASGLPFSALSDLNYDDQVISDPWEWSHTFVQPQMTSGFLLVHIVVDANRSFGVGHVMSATYAGADLPLFGHQLQNEGGFIGDVIAFLMLGDGSAFDSGELVIEFAGIANSEDVTAGIHVVFFEGIDQAVDPLQFDLGTLNTFVSPLALDPSPSADYDIVLTAAAQARAGASVTVEATAETNASWPLGGLWETLGAGYSLSTPSSSTPVGDYGSIDSAAVFGKTIQIVGACNNPHQGGTWPNSPLLLIGFGDGEPTFTTVTVQKDGGILQSFDIADATLNPGGGTVTYSGTLYAWPIATPTDLFEDGVTTEVIFSGGAPAELTLTLVGENYTQDTVATESVQAAEAIGWFFCDVSYNCACETDPEAKTLAELRVETLKLTGYAMQASNPPPGVAAQYNALLRTAQGYLITKYRALETERFFSWTLTPGIRYYGLRDNRNCCDVKLNKYRITGAWLQDLNNVWWPLIYGIDPTFYTLNVNFGWPAFYEIRQCIEIFPAPQAAYTLWIKGHFNLLPFEEDDDVTTINAEVVKNWAVFLAKSGKGARDADVYAAMAKDQVGQLISGAHVSHRYIPGTSEIPVPTPPVMVHFDA